MATSSALRTALLLTAGTLACSAALHAAETDCSAHGTLQFMCGPTAAEDLVQIAGTPWLIGSGLAEQNVPGRLQLIHSADKRWEVAFPSAAVRYRADAARYPDCPGPPPAETFSAHGLAIRAQGNGRHTLLVVNHGGREAIEVFDVEAGAATPALTWVGCVPMPDDVFVNSVAFLPDDGFVATKFYDRSKEGGMGAIFAGGTTGGVHEWHPGQGVKAIAGTELTGANGIEVSPDGKVLYVASWGSRELVRFDRSGASLKKDVVSLDFLPDNLRWAADGQLLVAGQKMQIRQDGPPQMDGWSVVKWAPDTLAVTPVYSADASAPLQGVSVGLQVGDTLWVGPFRGDRVGYVKLP